MFLVGWAMVPQAPGMTALTDTTSVRAKIFVMASFI
jgi:hypothetical protein